MLIFRSQSEINGELKPFEIKYEPGMFMQVVFVEDVEEMDGFHKYRSVCIRSNSPFD